MFFGIDSLTASKKGYFIKSIDNVHMSQDDYLIEKDPQLLNSLLDWR